MFLWFKKTKDNSLAFLLTVTVTIQRGKLNRYITQVGIHIVTELMLKAKLSNRHVFIGHDNATSEPKLLFISSPVISRYTRSLVDLKIDNFSS